MHTTIFEMAEEGNPYISVVYNIGLVVLMATALGLLMGKITDLISHEGKTSDTTDTRGKVDPE